MPFNKPISYSSADADVDVVVVGSGPVGLGLAMELSTRGISVGLVERSPRTSPQPRAKLVNVRSMTLMRRWGIADAVRAAAPLGHGWSGDIAFVTSLTGYEITRFADALMTQAVPGNVAPEPALTIPQYALEGVLRTELAGREGVSFFEPHEVVATASADDHVLVTTIDTQHRHRVIRARWLVGCDGAQSTVRRLLDVPMAGTDVIARNLGVVFRCDGLEDKLRHNRAVQYWVLSAGSPGIVGRLDADGTWWAQLTGLADQAAVAALDVRRHLSGMIGLDLPLHVTGTDSWAARSLLATTYRVGRAFLAGDAAHLHPPMGGYGMNMGLGDAVDLGWKLAAVLEGWADEALLDTYTSERRRVHERVLRESTANYRTLSQDLVTNDLDRGGLVGEAARRALALEITAAKSREFRSLGVQLGVTYLTEADDAPNLPAQDPAAYRPTAAPGHLAPHSTFEDGSCLYDALGPALTLLTRPEAAAFVPDAPHTVVRLTGPALETYEAPLTIVRPDQYVAHAGNPAASDLPNLVRAVVARGIVPTPDQEVESA